MSWLMTCRCLTGSRPVTSLTPMVTSSGRPDPAPSPGPQGTSGGPRGGGTAQDRQPSGTGFVRPAAPTDLPTMGRLHAATMLASLEAAHRSAHGAPLPVGVRAVISAPVVAAGWEQAVGDPPSPAHHVLLATQGETVVGLLGLAPTQVLDDDGAPIPGRRAAEVTALGVDPAHQRQGHGSRLLAAATDLARTDGAGALSVWAVHGDESLTRFLAAAGLQPSGAHRLLPVGLGITENCWTAAL